MVAKVMEAAEACQAVPQRRAMPPQVVSAEAVQVAPTAAASADPPQAAVLR